MTQEVFTAPGGYTSTKFSATVGGAAAGVISVAMATQMPTVAWNAGQMVELSWLVFDADVTTEVRVTRLAGAVTSFNVYPENTGHTAAIVGGVLVLQVPPNVRLHCEINGDRANILVVASSPLKPSLPVSYTTWGSALTSVSSLNTATGEFTTSGAHGRVVGDRVRLSTSGSLPTPSSGTLSTYDVLYVQSVSASNKLTLSRTSGGSVITYSAAGSGNSFYVGEWTNTSTAVYFPAGVHVIGQLFRLASGTTVYIDGGAVVIGSFDVRNSQNVLIRGRGNLFGTFATHATAAAAATFDEQLRYAMILGYDGVHFTYNNVVEGITIAAYPFYCTHEGVTSWTNVQLISPWTYNCDGFDCSESVANTGTATHSYAFTGDDAVRADSPWFEMTATDVFCVTSNAGCVLFSYWGGTVAGNTQRIVNCHGMSLSLADGDGAPGQVTMGADAIFKCWVDLAYSDWQNGTANIEVTNYHVWGPVGSRLFAFQNLPYPTASQQRDTRGNIRDITLDGLVCQQTPGQLSLLLGYDWQNTPHDIRFSGMSIGGTPVTTWNWGDFVRSNAFPYNIFIEGRPVVSKVDLVNEALSFIGEGLAVTSISPPDGSAAALAASRLWQAAVELTIGNAAWPFATRREALVAATNDYDDAFGYCYELPADHLRLLGVIPAGAQDTYTQSDGTPIPYQCQQDADGVERLYTDLGDAWVRYTVYVDDPNKWPPMFRRAFVFFLAAELCGSLVKDTSGARLAESLMNRGLAMSQAAIAESASKREVRPAHTVPWLRPRASDVLPRSTGG